MLGNRAILRLPLPALLIPFPIINFLFGRRPVPKGRWPPLLGRARPQGGRAHPLFTLRKPWPQNGISLLMDAGTPKKVPYRWFLRLTEPANPPRMIKQKVAPQPSSPTQKGRRVKKRFSALAGGGSLALLLPLRCVESGSR